MLTALGDDNGDVNDNHNGVASCNGFDCVKGSGMNYVNGKNKIL